MVEGTVVFRVATGIRIVAVFPGAKFKR
jgi:hypothetical protein